jgi:hypothetical protein
MDQNKIPKILGQNCEEMPRHYTRRQLQILMRIFGLRAQLQSYDLICKSLREYFVKNGINNEDELQKHIKTHYPDYVDDFPIKQQSIVDLDVLFNSNSEQFIIDNEYFANFTKYSRDIKEIGSLSANGFIRKLTYTSKGINYSIVLKNSMPSTKDRTPDSLIYEFLVGKCINLFSTYYPCFPKTYIAGIYKTVDDWKYIRDIKGEIQLPKPLSDYISKIDTSNLDRLILDSCQNNQLLCIFTQYIPISDSIYSFLDSMCLNNVFLTANTNKLYALTISLHMIYSFLSNFADYFTHYDLHTDNLVLVKIPNDQYVQVNYHDDKGNIITYKTEYIPIIIDYGHSYINCDHMKRLISNPDERGLIQNSENIIKKVCSYDNSNPDSNKNKCKDTCGDKTGYTWTPSYTRSTHTFKPQTKDNYYIDPVRPNRTHDLHLLSIIKTEFDFKHVSRTNFIGKSLISDFFDKKVQVSQSPFGSSENMNILTDKVYNVNTAYRLLNDIVKNTDFNLNNDPLFTSKKLYKTINIYTDLSRPFSTT